MLQGYFDDSGTENQSSVVTLAGFVAHGEKWSAFSGDWDKLLKQHHMAVFKMQKESKRRRQERDARIAEFAAVIRQYVAFKLDCSISVSDFQVVVKGAFIAKILKSIPLGSVRNQHELTEHELTKLCGNYYFWGFHNLIASVCRGIWHRGYHLPFDVFFDEQLIDGQIARKSYVISKCVAPLRAPLQY